MGIVISIDDGIMATNSESVQTQDNNRKQEVIRLSSVDDIIKVLQKLDDARLEKIPIHPDTDDKVSIIIRSNPMGVYIARVFFL
jgi:hypothetical protein